MKLSELFTSEDKWCKGAFAQTKNAAEVQATSQLAVRWCLVGGILKSELANFSTKTRLLNIIHKMFPEVYYPDIVGFNDAPETTFKRIKQVIEQYEKENNN